MNAVFQDVTWGNPQDVASQLCCVRAPSTSACCKNWLYNAPWFLIVHDNNYLNLIYFYPAAQISLPCKIVALMTDWCLNDVCVDCELIRYGHLFVIERARRFSDRRLFIYSELVSALSLYHQLTVVMVNTVPFFNPLK